jgi:hypothetical protein
MISVFFLPSSLKIIVVNTISMRSYIRIKTSPDTIVHPRCKELCKVN